MAGRHYFAMILLRALSRACDTERSYILPFDASLCTTPLRRFHFALHSFISAHSRHAILGSRLISPPRVLELHVSIPAPGFHGLSAYHFNLLLHRTDAESRLRLFQSPSTPKSAIAATPILGRPATMAWLPLDFAMSARKICRPYRRERASRSREMTPPSLIAELRS